MRGAKEAGHKVEKITLRGKDIRFCCGCLACQKTGKCVIQDDMHSITQDIHYADVIAFATPIYYLEMCGQMKTLLDRSNLIRCKSARRVTSDNLE
ncbi:MAG: flavodoxin family protein [Prevotella sp.]